MSLKHPEYLTLFFCISFSSVGNSFPIPVPTSTHQGYIDSYAGDQGRVSRFRRPVTIGTVLRTWYTSITPHFTKSSSYEEPPLLSSLHQQTLAAIFICKEQGGKEEMKCYGAYFLSTWWLSTLLQWALGKQFSWRSCFVGDTSNVFHMINFQQNLLQEETVYSQQLKQIRFIWLQTLSLELNLGQCQIPSSVADSFGMFCKCRRMLVLCSLYNSQIAYNA